MAMASRPEANGPTPKNALDHTKQRHDGPDRAGDDDPARALPL